MMRKLNKKRLLRFVQVLTRKYVLKLRCTSCNSKYSFGGYEYRANESGACPNCGNMKFEIERER
jgi:DNA polymerase II large subunit